MGLHSLAILLLSAALTQAKFCPRENNGDECRANSTTYKCGVFFKDLTPKLPLTWLGALPDALDKVDEADYKRILGRTSTRRASLTPTVRNRLSTRGVTLRRAR